MSCFSLAYCRAIRFFALVSPAYGFSALALVKCSNEEGPGPRHNTKEDPGTSSLVMKGEHGQEVPCDPGQVTAILGTTCPPSFPPHQGTQDRTPSHPLSEGTPHPWHQYPRRIASEKAHFGLGYKIRSHGIGKRRMRRPLSAFQLLFRRQDS